MGQLIYVVFLGPVMGIAVYAVFRMYLWGTLLGVVVNHPLEFALTKCASIKPMPLIPFGSLSFYWACVNAITSKALFLNFITVRTLSTSAFSLGLGFIIAIGLLTVALTPRQRTGSVKHLMIAGVLISLLYLTIIAGLSYMYYPQG